MRHYLIVGWEARMTEAKREVSPMIEMNMTPLIDVLLVLLIMFIITIPVQSHAVKVDLPGPPPGVVIDRLKNQVAVTQDGALLWNGKAVSDGEFSALLVATTRLPDPPELHLQPDALARYERVDEVLAMTKRAQVTRMGFVGNEKYRRF
jgi:biopolymer transport protein ExbD